MRPIGSFRHQQLTSICCLARILVTDTVPSQRRLARTPPADGALWRRRRFLRLAAGAGALVPLALAGCSGGGNGEAQITGGGGGAAGTRSNSTASPTATGTRVPDSLNVTLQPPQVGIGETLSIRARAPNASAVAVDFRGASYRMLPRNPGEFWLVVGVPLDA